MQMRAGENHGASRFRAIQMGTKLWKAQMSPVVAAIQVDRQGELSVRRGRTEIVPVRMKEATIYRIITGDLEAFESRCPVGEGTL